MNPIALSTNAAAITSRLDAFPRAMLVAIGVALDQVNEETVGVIQRDKLSRRGPMTLGVVTNRLRSSVRPSKAVVTDDGVDSSIGTNVKYAGVHEYGSHAVVNVPAHTRRRPADALGKAVSAVFNPATGRIARGKTPASGPIQVKAHTQQQNFPARAFLSGTIIERGDIYSRAVSEAIVFTWDHGKLGAAVADASQAGGTPSTEESP